jgi:DNA-binding transcriptional LysR family regulator
MGKLNLVDEQIDAAVRIGQLPDRGMIAARLRSVRRVICGSSNHFRANGMTRTPNDLAALTCVTFQFASRDRLVLCGRRENLTQYQRPRCRQNINTADAAIKAAIAGSGVTYVLSYQNH